MLAQLQVVLNTGDADVTGSDLKVQTTNANHEKSCCSHSGTLYSRCITWESNDALVSPWGARGVSLTLMRTCSVSLPASSQSHIWLSAQTARLHMIDDHPGTITIIAFLCSYQTPFVALDLLKKIISEL